MRFLIVLATILLVPIVMKFQQRDFQQRHEDELRVQVVEVLEENGVELPKVFQQFFDARIGGVVGSPGEAERVGQLVDRLPGVRLASNELKVKGWLEVGRVDEKLVVTGLLPKGWSEELLKGQAKEQVRQGGLEESGNVVMPGPGATRWGVFLDDYFRVGGERSFSVEGGMMTMKGEATPGLAKRWKERGEALLSGAVVDELELYPSPYHFPERVVECELEESQRVTLQRKLSNAEVMFAEYEEELTAEGRSEMSEWVGLILGVGGKSRYVVGVHPGSGEDAGEAMERAEKVRAWLVEQGIEGWALEAVNFEFVPGDRGGRPGLVEIFIR